jgi:hypothetical protein
LARRQISVHHSHKGDDSPVVVVGGIEDESPGGLVRVALWWRDPDDYTLQQLVHPGTRLAGNPQNVVGFDAHEGRQLLGNKVRLGRGKVDLVEDRDDLQAGLNGQI